MNDIRNGKESTASNNASSGDLVLVGYPKSGNTWATRLFAEVLDLPVQGFLGSDHEEIATEGDEQEGGQRCFKSHHPASQLDQLTSDGTKVLMVVRDPRDVMVSGSEYFKFKRLSRFSRVLRRSRVARSVQYRIDRRFRLSRRARIDRMIRVMLCGGHRGEVPWGQTPWSDYVTDFLDRGIPMVRYEDLLEEAESTVQRSLEALSLSADPVRIRAAVDNQSFDKAKQRFVESGDLARQNHLRSGRSGEWRQALNEKQKKRVRGELKPALLRLGYPLD
jgi:hypothetical protein